ncbi:MAG: ABC transporter substrate-binding protein [Labilithrix sp.]|nr:ABC transporter substrate-binding protein [Labilithrix sp.]
MTIAIGRRALLGGLAGAVAAGAAVSAVARRRSSGERVFRVGVMSNLTHAPMLAGLGSGRIALALAPARVETRVFRAGPRVTEALIGGAIEAGTAGPAAVVVHHARHARGGRGGLRVLSGACSGGASLIVTRASGIARAADLRGKRLAVTQIGTTQDVALRSFLRDAGLREAAAGGDVTVLAIAGATILEQMRRGDLHGAWLPEPWATRIVGDLSAVRLVDERDLWPGRRFATAVLTTRAADAADPLMVRLSRALDDEVARALDDPRATLAEAHAELTRHVGNPGAFGVFEEAARFVDFTADPLRASIERFGDAAAALGLCPPRPSDGLFA